MRVVVVGAGILGASAAYHLARSGAEVVVVDRADPGQATAAGAGIVSPWARSEDTAAQSDLGRASARYYRELAADLAEATGEDLGFVEVGGLSLAEDDEELEGRYRLLVEQRPSAPEIGEVQRVRGADVAEFFPPLRDDLAALHVSGAGRVDGRQVRDALRAGASASSARFETGSAELSTRDGAVVGVTVEGSRIDADTVVLAAGAWTGSLCEAVGVRVPVAPQRGQILHLGLAGAATERWPVVHAFRRHYLLAFPGGRVVVGATREDGTGFDHRTTAGGLVQVLEAALEVAPGLEQATVLETRIGFRPAGPDGLPLLGAVPGLPGLVVATGLGPRGLTVGPFVGRLAADIALGREPAHDVGPFDPFRGG